jgi:hypothetical protein
MQSTNDSSSGPAVGAPANSQPKIVSPAHRAQVKQALQEALTLNKLKAAGAPASPNQITPGPRPSNSFLRANEIPSYQTKLTLDQVRANYDKSQELLKSQPRPAKIPPRSGDKALSRAADQFAIYARELAPAGNALPFESPLHLLAAIAPDWPAPHPWQEEELLRVAGYVHYPEPAKVEFTPENPLKMVLSAANGSGKDQFYIALTAVWFAIKGIKNRSIITTASEKQLKTQTQPHIIDIVERINKLFPGTFEYVHFHFACRLTGSEIVLFVTNEAGRAEGFHPWPGGSMLMIFNEAKSIDDILWQAFRRCTGYSYWLEVSSPGPKVGHFFRSAQSAVEYPQRWQPNQFYLRYISAFDCPHIPRGHIEDAIKNETPEWVESSIYARFSNIGQRVIIAEVDLLACKAPQLGADIGIGLDLAAGGDENACYVRQGNKIVHQFFFKQSDTELAVSIIDTQLASYKQRDYVFNADDGHVGHAMIGTLISKGWRINRRCNQSSSHHPEFLNLGARMWFEVRKHVLAGALAPIPNDPTLRRQLTTRLYEQQDTSGKLKLESKDSARGRAKESPDRADAFVLCFFSYQPGATKTSDASQPPVKGISVEEYLEQAWTSCA